MILPFQKSLLRRSLTHKLELKNGDDTALMQTVGSMQGHLILEFDSVKIDIFLELHTRGKSHGRIE